MVPNMEEEKPKKERRQRRRAHYPITVLCRVLQVSRAGFYAWFGRPPSPRAVEDARLTVLVREAHERGRRLCGSPRVHKELIAQEVFVSRKRVIRLMQAEKITCSMSRRGNCYDNAAMESWFSTLKSELGERFESNAAAKEQLFDYIEVFYNQQRRYSAIDYVSPAKFEKAARERQAA